MPESDRPCGWAERVDRLERRRCGGPGAGFGAGGGGICGGNAPWAGQARLSESDGKGTGRPVYRPGAGAECILRRGIPWKNRTVQAVGSGADRADPAGDLLPDGGQRAGLHQGGGPELRAGNFAAGHPQQRPGYEHPAAVWADSQPAAPAVSLYAHEPHLRRPVLRPQTGALRPGGVRRGLPAPHQQGGGCPGPGAERGGSRRPKADAAHLLLRCQHGGWGQPGYRGPGEHSGRLPRTEYAPDPPALALPQSARESDRLQQQLLLWKQALHLPLGQRPGVQGQSGSGGGHLRPGQNAAEPGGGWGSSGGAEAPLPRSGAVPIQRGRRHLQYQPAEPDRRPSDGGLRGRPHTGTVGLWDGGAGIYQKFGKCPGRWAGCDPVLRGLWGGSGRESLHELRSAEPGGGLAAAECGGLPGAEWDEGLFLPGSGADRPLPQQRGGCGGSSGVSGVCPGRTAGSGREVPGAGTQQKNRDRRFHLCRTGGAGISDPVRRWKVGV